MRDVRIVDRLSGWQRKEDRPLGRDCRINSGPRSRFLNCLMAGDTTVKSAYIIKIPKLRETLAPMVFDLQWRAKRIQNWQLQELLAG